MSVARSCGIGLGLALAVWLCFAAPPAIAEDAAAVGTLRVHITHLRDATGKVLVQLANSRRDYEEDEKAFRYAVLPARGSEVTAVFADVPAGEYAVKFFHDTNGNRELDIGWRGPKEAYGFSNNATGLFGPPDYDEAKFSFAGGEQTIEIEAR